MNGSAPAAYFKKNFYMEMEIDISRRIIYRDSRLRPARTWAATWPGSTDGPSCWSPVHAAVLSIGSRTAADNAELSTVTHLKRF
jgi:hypothetical protein